MDNLTDIQLAELLGGGDEATQRQRAQSLVAALRQQQARAEDQQATAGLSGFFNAQGANTMGKAYGDIGAQQYETAGKQLEEIPKTQQARLKLALERQQAVRERAQKISDTQEQRTYQEGRDERQNAAAMERARVLSSTKAGDKASEAAGKVLEEVGPSAEVLANQMGQIKGIAGPPGQDIPGTGATGMLPSVALTGAGKDLRGYKLGIMADLLRVQSGATVPPEELARKEQQYGFHSTATDDQFRGGIDRLVDDAAIGLEARLKALSPAAFAEYKSRGGILPEQVRGLKISGKPSQKAAGGLTPQEAKRLADLEAKAKAGTLK